MNFVIDEKIVKRLHELQEMLEEELVPKKDVALMLKYVIEDIEMGAVVNG